MKHSNERQWHWAFIVIEIILFAAAIVCAYLSETSKWNIFIVISIIATILFAWLKYVEAVPQAKAMLIKESMAAKMALSAKAYGVKEYFNMQSSIDQAERNKRTQQEIERARSLWLCANSGASFLDPGIYRHWSIVERRLREGVEFRVVLLDPYSREKALRNQINVSGEQFDSKINLANLIKLINNYPSLEIRFAGSGMHATVFATEHCLFFDPYHVGIVGDRIENRSFSLHIEPTEPNEGVGLYRLFKSHFDTLWRSGTPFHNWMGEYEDRLPQGLPKLNAR
jgi:hypothetical protein